VFGFGPWDEDSGSDAEGEAVELLLAGDVLDWLVLQAASDGGIVGGLLFWCDFAIWIGVELRARDVERVQQERERVACGGFAQLMRSGELRGGAGEDGGERCQVSVLRLLRVGRRVGLLFDEPLGEREH